MATHHRNPAVYSADRANRREISQGKSLSVCSGGAKAKSAELARGSRTWIERSVLKNSWFVLSARPERIQMAYGRPSDTDANGLRGAGFRSTSPVTSDAPKGRVRHLSARISKCGWRLGKLLIGLGKKSKGGAAAKTYFGLAGASQSPKRPSDLSSFSSDALTCDDVTEREDGAASPRPSDVFSPRRDDGSPRGERRLTSTPEDRRDDDNGRARAWLGVHAGAAARPSCCKAVQTDAQCMPAAKGDPAEAVAHVPSCRGDAPPARGPISSSRPTGGRHRAPRAVFQTPGEGEKEAEGRRRGKIQQRASGAAPLAKRLLLLAAAASLLLACVLWSLVEAACPAGTRPAGACPAAGLHLRYVNGPPPT